MNFYNAVILSVIFICCASLTTALTAEDYKSEDVISFEFSITLCEDHRDNVEHRSQDMNAMEELPRILFDFFNLTNWFRKLEPDKFDINKGIPVVGEAEIQDTNGCRKYMYRVHYLCCLTKLENASEEILFTVEMITDSCKIGEYGDSYGRYRMDCEHMKQQKENNPRNIKQKVYTAVARHKSACQHHCECTCRASWTDWLKNAGPYAVGGAVLGWSAAPYLVSYVAGLMGIGAAGIKAGSIVAWSMRFYGGAVPAGGLVATLQAMGAAGTGWTSAMMGGAIGTATGFILSCRC